MSAQDILQAFYLPALPAMKPVQYSSPSNLLNIPSRHPHDHRSRSSEIPSHEGSSYSLIRHLFLKLWIETCASHSRPPPSATTATARSVSAGVWDSDGDKNVIFHFHCHSVHPLTMTEESVVAEDYHSGRSADLLFLLHQHHFYPSLQQTIASLTDFQLLFHADTYHTIPPPSPAPALPSPPPPPPLTDSVDDLESDDESIPDLDEIVEQAISEFISKDGFDETSIEYQRGRRSAKASLPSQEDLAPATEPSQTSAPAPLPPRKMRSILSLLSSLPSPLQLSSSLSLDSQLFKVSEVLIASSVIALHHLLKYDRQGKVQRSLLFFLTSPQYWFGSLDFVKRIHSGGLRFHSFLSSFSF
jgi:hypothetical protein